MFLRAPRDKISAKEYKIATGRSLCIRTTNPISVRISKQLMRRGAVKLKTMMDYAFNITQYAFECSKMIFSWSMHVLANRIDTKKEIRSSDGQILQGFYKRPKKSGIRK